MSTWKQQSEHPEAPRASTAFPERDESEGGRGRVSETVVQATGREPGELAGDLGYVMRRNALPLALIGAGAAWLTVSLSRGQHAHDDLEAAGEYAGAARRRAGAKAAEVQGQARSSIYRGREAAAERAAEGREKAQGMIESARDVYHRNPLLVGLLAAGGAAAVATAVAARTGGGRFTGYARERASAVADRAAEQAREQASKARNVAERTARAASETAADEAQREGLVGAERVAGGRRTGGGNGSASQSASQSSGAAGSSGNTG